MNSNDENKSETGHAPKAAIQVDARHPTGGCTGRGWLKGVSGNPAGRKPKARFCETLREALSEPVDETDIQSKTKLQAIVDTLIRKCIDGDSKCLTIFIQHCDPVRTKAAIRAGTVNVLSVGNHDGDGDIQDEIRDFVASLPSILKANALPPDAGFRPIAHRVESRPRNG